MHAVHVKQYKALNYYYCYSGSMTLTTDHEQTDCKPYYICQLAEKGNHKHILLSPEPSCPNPHFVMKVL